MEEHLIIFYTHRHSLCQLPEFLFHLVAHFQYVVTARTGYADAQRPLSVAQHGVACHLFITLAHIGNVAYAQLVVVVSGDEHVGNVFHRAELVIHGDTYSSCPVVIISSIRGGVLSVERLYHFCRQHSEICHLLLFQVDIDTFWSFAVNIHACHTVDGEHFSLDEFGIVAELAVGESVAGQGIEHAIHIAEIICHGHHL